jgi:hypothetical protein
VWGNGKIPKPVEGIDFIHADDLRVANYWMVLFESERVSALLLCRQKNKTDVFPKKKFVGFYTFNPFLVESVRRHFNLLTSGLPGLVEQWEKLIDLP